MVTVPTGKSLLIVDDSRELPLLIERAFRQVQPGTVVFPLSSGERAIEHLIQCGERYPLPDLILLNLKMTGGMDGFETLVAIRRIERLGILPVLILSGSDDEMHVARARDVGADGYVRKPVERDEVASFAKQVLSWRIEESWRRSGGNATGMELAECSRELQSVGKTAMASTLSTAATDAIPIPQDPNVLVRLYEHFKDMARQAFDPVELLINDSCRRHHIPPSHARGRGQDQVTVANRRMVIFEVFAAGYSDRVVMEHFIVSERQVERLRADWRAKHGGGLALRGK